MSKVIDSRQVLDANGDMIHVPAAVADRMEQLEELVKTKQPKGVTKELIDWIKGIARLPLDERKEVGFEKLYEVAYELDRLQAVESWIPKCWRLNADGKLVRNANVIPGMQIWSWIGLKTREPGVSPAQAQLIEVDNDWMDEQEQADLFDDRFDSKDAALAGEEMIKGTNK